MPSAELITSPERYQMMIAHLGGQKAIAIDTESNSLFAYQERVCLIQLSSRERDYLLDPFAFDDLQALGELMADERVQKIMHAGDYDISTLKRDYDFTFNNVFDTMLAASALGESSLGLSTLLEKYFGIELAKKYQRANWGERPVKDDMLRYAQADSHFLIPLRDYLLPRLEAIGWLELVQEDSNAMAKNTPAMKPHCEDVWRVKGTRDLSPEEMSLLAELNHQRELQAQKRDRPPFKIFGDPSMVAIAQAMPQTLEELSALKVFSKHQMKRYGNLIVNTVTNWLEKPTKLHRPAVLRPCDAELERHEALKKLRKTIAEKEGIASNLVLPRDLLEKIARHDPQSMPELESLMSDYPLRFARFGKAIFDLLLRRRL